MKISMILSQIDLGLIALPAFQRGYVWTRPRVQRFFESLYRGYPVGSLLMWSSDSDSAQIRGSKVPTANPFKLLLDGQQRLTTLYGVLRGKQPPFFDGNAKAFEGLYFHLDEETFAFPKGRSAEDPIWVNVTDLMRGGFKEAMNATARLHADGATAAQLESYQARMAQLILIGERALHIDDVGGDDLALDDVVDIFNRVNSGGTKLSKGDLAMAKICADWPDARGEMQQQLTVWAERGREFDLDWLLKALNTVLTGDADYSSIHKLTADDVQDGMRRTVKALNAVLNKVGGRLGLDHTRVLFGRAAFFVMARYVDQRRLNLSNAEWDRLLYWYVQSAIWGRYAFGAPRAMLAIDLQAIAEPDGGIDRLVEELHKWHGSLEIEPLHFDVANRTSRFYPVLYMMTRMGGARDFCSGNELRKDLLGKENQLELHHIFPKARLRKAGFEKAESNALANYSFLTADCNKLIGSRPPEDYLPEAAMNHPGAIESQWIPADPKLWNLKQYRRFLGERRKLLAAAINKHLDSLYRGELDAAAPLEAIGGIAPDDELRTLHRVNAWVDGQGLHQGMIGFELIDEETREQRAVLDLAWPDGVEEELSEPIALLLNEPDAVLAAAAEYGFRCFTDRKAFERYVLSEVLGQADAA